jgi:hypothetical protein
MSLFNDLIDWPITSPRLQWEGKVVVRDWKNEPHLFFRLKLSGTYFVERSSEAFIQIGKLRSKFVQIAPDGLSVNGYFDKLPPLEGVVEFGYGAQVFLVCGRKFDIGGVNRLKKALLPSNIRNLDQFAKLLDGGGPL